MMKRYFLLLWMLIPGMIMAQSPDKLIERGEYDKAIKVCVDKLSKGKGRTDDLYNSLGRAYQIANADDQSRITELKAGGEPDIWFEIFLAYNRMQARYRVIEPISPLLERDRVNIPLLDYTTDLEAARQKAAAYLYAHSVSLLETGQKADAGLAFEELLRLSKLYKGFKDTELLMRKALGAGATLARLEVNNRSGVSLPPDFISEMEDMLLNQEEKQFLDYVVKPNPGQHCSLILSINLRSVNVTPGTVNEKEYTASHKNPESFAENYEDKKKFEEDKKHPDFNKCKIKEIYQVKTAVIAGDLKYIDQASGKTLFMVPITARSVFENKTATASGDLFACPPDVYDILDKPRKKFPKNAEMIYRAGREFKVLVRGIIWDESFVND